MPIRRRIRRSVYSGLKLDRAPQRSRKGLVIGFCAFVIILVIAGSLYLRILCRSMAISDARDAVTLAINGCVNRILRENDYGGDHFVSLEKDAEGNITAITADTAHINALSSQLLSEIARAADSETLHLRIPLGSLLGSDLLMGRGPQIPVEVLMLTSSFVRFDNDLISTGINQSRHVITLKADVDIDILMPWETITTTVETDVLIAETVIIGRVPDTYVHVTEDYHGSQ
jgi:sporulation protein YunB